jgi:hypothetical protein
MSVTGGGRTIVAAAVGTALVLGASGARAQAAAGTCELTIVVSAPQDPRPWGGVLVTNGSGDAPHECVRAARVLAMVFMQSGENVYVRGFGSFVIKKVPPKARAEQPKLSRAE